ncbi:hypothetical protein RvY_10791 [Ramazzottius varieornatus]|uniref:Uncharacterized protein n=1 Tax=Ramazzottius varieornatus TaxID=947166 RepID=A0A1D1VDY2_RAMVA|nr:hypothetical protein RvY_10791 [Ramazzottius varieornatus]
MRHWHILFEGCGISSVLLLLQTLTQNVHGQSLAYSRLNPITYYGYTQPYLSGFYGGIGAMPYMSSWQASMYQGNNNFGALGMNGLGAYGIGMGGFGSWNSAPTLSVRLLPVALSISCLLLLKQFISLA